MEMIYMYLLSSHTRNSNNHHRRQEASEIHVYHCRLLDYLSSPTNKQSQHYGTGTCTPHLILSYIEAELDAHLYILVR